METVQQAAVPEQEPVQDGQPEQDRQPEQRARQRVVVGVDGSPSSRRALVFAADEAQRRAAELTVVSCFDVPDMLWLGHGAAATPLDDRLQVARRAARKVVDEEVPDQSGLQIDVVATTTAPTVALIDRSAEADLLVVGSRGRGGFRGLVMGSVSMQCMLHAHCPVAVVRASNGGTGDNGGGNGAEPGRSR
jgi:nucleotide-binding universal stress UspA family protein